MMRKPGETAPDFALRSLKGEIVSLASLTAAGPVAIAFFKVSCPTCQYTLPFLQRLRSHNVIAISQDSPADTHGFHNDLGITLPTLIDPKADAYPASNAWGLTHVPSVFLVETDGTVAAAHSGFSRDGLESIAARFGTTVFRSGEKVPAFRPG